MAVLGSWRAGQGPGNTPQVGSLKLGVQETLPTDVTLTHPCLLSTYCVPGTVRGASDGVELSSGLPTWWGRAWPSAEVRKDCCGPQLSPSRVWASVSRSTSRGNWSCQNPRGWFLLWSVHGLEKNFET